MPLDALQILRTTFFKFNLTIPNILVKMFSPSICILMALPEYLIPDGIKLEFNKKNIYLNSEIVK